MAIISTMALNPGVGVCCGEVWCVNPLLLAQCTSEANVLVSNAEQMNERRNRTPQNYTRTDGGVVHHGATGQRLNICLLYSSSYRLFSKFLGTHSFGIGGVPFARAPILDPDKYPALIELTRKIGQAFRLDGLVAVMMQIVSEAEGYELPYHTDRPDWVCAVSITLSGDSVEWSFRLPEGEKKVMISPGQCWAVSWFGAKVMPYDTPHAHAPVTSPRLAIVVRFKRVPTEIGFDFDTWWLTHGSGELTVDTIKFLKTNLNNKYIV